MNERQIFELIKNKGPEKEIHSIKIQNSSEVAEKLEEFLKHPQSEKYILAAKMSKSTVKHNYDKNLSIDHKLWTLVEELVGGVEHEKIIRYKFDYFKNTIQKYQKNTGMSKKEIVKYLSEYSNNNICLVRTLVGFALDNKPTRYQSVEENMVAPLLDNFKPKEPVVPKSLENTSLFFKVGHSHHMATYLTDKNLVSCVEEFLSSGKATEIGINLTELAPRKIRRHETFYSIRQIMSFSQKPRLENSLKELGLQIHYHGEKFSGDYAQKIIDYMKS